ILSHCGLGVIKTYQLSYFPRRGHSTGFREFSVLLHNPDSSLALVCVKYNSRFPRAMRKVRDPTGICPVPGAGSAPELRLQPGQIVVYSSDHFMEFPAGYDGRPDMLEAPDDGDGEDSSEGGIAFLFIYGEAGVEM
ncbi:hypothetical protein GP486_007543, partial [Trichoglossum hirsutum]